MEDVDMLTASATDHRRWPYTIARGVFAGLLVLVTFTMGVFAGSSAVILAQYVSVHA